MSKKSNISVRKNSERYSEGLSSDLPLTSKRVKIILSSPVDSHRLAMATRQSRIGGKGNFTVTEEVSKNIYNVIDIN